MILEQSEKVHIIVRRTFDNDLRRHFIGEVLKVSGALARVEGYVYVLDTGTNLYIRRPDKRIRIFGLADAGYIINVLPPNADLEHTQYTLSQEKRLIVTDGKTFTLDAFAKRLEMAKQKFRHTRLSGFSGVKAYIRYVEVLKNRCNAGGRTFCDAITLDINEFGTMQ